MVAETVLRNRSPTREQGIFRKSWAKTGSQSADGRWLLEIPIWSKAVTGSPRQFPVIPQNRRLRCENRRWKTQYQTSVTLEQVTSRRESRTSDGAAHIACTALAPSRPALMRLALTCTDPSFFRFC